MDRIYYFRLAKEELKGKIGRPGKKSWELPIFFKEIGSYEVYYLQMYEDMDNNDLAAIQAYMSKGICRLAECQSREADGDNAYLVYDANFSKWLHGRQKEAQWQSLWQLPLYSEYKEAHNLAFLLQRLSLAGHVHHLIILGEAPGMQDWIDGLAKQTKRITFYSMTAPRGYEAVREKLQEEYGLLTKWEKSLQPVSRESVLVLDYSRTEKIYVWGVPRGSIWVDMTSMEERRHALEDRDTGIRYISLKSIWREEMIQTLDTAGKIQYNTEVNLEGKVGI